MSPDIQARLEALLAEWPMLVATGFVTPDQDADAVQCNRQYLLKRWEEVATVVAWLADVTPTRRLTDWSSYELKHYVERTPPRGYISNGAMIAGALLAGFRVRRFDRKSPNAQFNMRTRDIRRKMPPD